MRHAVAADRLGAHAGVLRRARAEQVVGADAERRGERGEVVEREPALAGLEAAERREVDVRALGDLGEREPLLGAELAQPSPDADVDGLLICRHGKCSLPYRDAPVTLKRMDTNWDCIVVGAGAAGLSAALVLGRARRRTLVVDAGGQSNRAVEGIGGLLGHDHRPPADFYALGRDELAAYPAVEVRDGVVDDRAPRRARRSCSSSTTARSRPPAPCCSPPARSTGSPTLPGVAERWGRSVFHCPFCHGWEHRDGQAGACSATTAHRPLLLRMWSDDVTLLTNGPAALEPEAAEQIAAAGVEIDEREVERIDDPGATVVFANGERRELSGLLVPVTLHQRSAARRPARRRLRRAGTPSRPRRSRSTPSSAQSVPGLFAAGDATTQMPSVASAVAAGHTAAAMVVRAAEQHRRERLGEPAGVALRVPCCRCAGLRPSTASRSPTSARGSGPPVVLLHGWPGDHTDHEDVVPLLTPDYEVVVPDLRGFGESDKHLEPPARGLLGASRRRAASSG